MELPETTKYPELTDPQGDEIIQELLSQHYLTLSKNNPNPKTELYLEIVSFT